MRKTPRPATLDPLDAATALLERVARHGGRWALWLFGERAVYLPAGDAIRLTCGAVLVGVYDARALTEHVVADVMAARREVMA
jgi:hypothetical protein